MICKKCNSETVYVGKGVWVCENCGTTTEKETRTSPRVSMYERTRAQVYATGNKWAIENFHATHD